MNKGKFILVAVEVIFSIALLIITSVLSEKTIINTSFTTVLTILSLVLLFLSITHAAKVDYETGIYECRKCKYKFIPTFKAYIMGPHSTTTRYLKCPECEEKSWCKRKMKY